MRCWRWSSPLVTMRNPYRSKPQTEDILDDSIGILVLWQPCGATTPPCIVYYMLLHLVTPLSGILMKYPTGNLSKNGFLEVRPNIRYSFVSFPVLRKVPFWKIYSLLALMEKAMTTHSSTLVWKIPWTEEPGRQHSVGSLRVGHDWATSLSLFTFMHWRRKWQPTPVFLPGESQGQGSLVGCRLWGRPESDTTEAI